MPLITLKDVSAGYDGKKVLSDILFDIYDDDFVGVTGPNGGGKTTLVKVVIGLLPYSSGTIEYADSLIVNGIRRIGYLPQQNVFDRSFPISVADVVASGLQAEKGFGGRFGRDDYARAHNLLEMTGLTLLENRPIGEISGGQMQRALLCRALIAEPRLLILDEPTTYVDNHFEDELYGLLRELNARMAIMMVSHDTAALTDVAKRVLHIDGTIK